MVRRIRLHPEDTPSRAPVDCRFTPDVWEWMPDQNEYLPRFIKHDRYVLASQKNTNLKWPSLSTNLAQDIIVGPIDFTPRKPPTYTQQGPPETHRIANSHWNILEDRAHEFQLNISNLRQTPPQQI